MSTYMSYIHADGVGIRITFLVCAKDVYICINIDTIYMYVHSANVPRVTSTLRAPRFCNARAAWMTSSSEPLSALMPVSLRSSDRFGEIYVHRFRYSSEICLSFPFV